VAVLVSAAFYAACAAFTFRELIVLNMWLYSLSLLVELAAFVWLRAAEPQMHRPWRVPGGMPGAIAAAVLPSCFALGAMATPDGQYHRGYHRGADRPRGVRRVGAVQRAGARKGA